MKKIYFLCLVAIAVIFMLPLASAADIPSIPEFNQEDRVLILAPHPDDEAIGTGGVIQKALKAGAKVRVVCFTNGDHNELAFIVYERRITFRRGEFIHLGEIRRKETILGMKSLGLNENDIVFLGYPDFGTMEILTKYWGNTKPFKNMLNRISKVPYPECLSPNAPYLGESILKDIKTVIVDFKPTKVLVSHPGDVNRDHRSLYLFLHIALWDLEGRIKQPEIFPYLIHAVGWPRPRGYHPDLELEPPEQVKNCGIFWQKLELDQEEIKAKHDAIAFYKSQIEYSPPYLFTFARKNELFGDYPAIKVSGEEKLDNSEKDRYAEEMSWQYLQPVKNKKDKAQKNTYIANLSYYQKDGNLFVEVTPKREISKDFDLSVFLLGYSKKINFPQMPKINLTAATGGLRIKDKKQTIFIKDVQLKYEGNSLIIKVPLSVLGNPDYLLASVRTNSNDLPYYETAWRIIELK